MFSYMILIFCLYCSYPFPIFVHYFSIYFSSPLLPPTPTLRGPFKMMNNEHHVFFHLYSIRVRVLYYNRS